MINNGKRQCCVQEVVVQQLSWHIDAVPVLFYRLSTSVKLSLTWDELHAFQSAIFTLSVLLQLLQSMDSRCVSHVIPTLASLSLHVSSSRLLLILLYIFHLGRQLAEAFNLHVPLVYEDVQYCLPTSELKFYTPS